MNEASAGLTIRSEPNLWLLWVASLADKFWIPSSDSSLQYIFPSSLERSGQRPTGSVEHPMLLLRHPRQMSSFCTAPIMFVTSNEKDRLLFLSLGESLLVRQYCPQTTRSRIQFCLSFRCHGSSLRLLLVSLVRIISVGKLLRRRLGWKCRPLLLKIRRWNWPNGFYSNIRSSQNSTITTCAITNRVLYQASTKSSL